MKLAFEYNGSYWYNDENLIARSKGYFKNSDEYHQYKTNECLKKGVKLIHIDENEWLKDKNKVLNFGKECIDERIKETLSGFLMIYASSKLTVAPTETKLKYTNSALYRGFNIIVATNSLFAITCGVLFEVSQITL